MAGWPDWAFPTIFVALCLILYFGFAWFITKRQIAATLERRLNPTREEFLALMGDDASPAAAEYLWETALFYLAPRLTPHPDDDLAHDLPIDEDDWSMDWPVDFAKLHGFSDKVFSAWPDGWPATLRNYGKWLDMGLSAAGKNSPSTSSGQTVL